MMTCIAHGVIVMDMLLCDWYIIVDITSPSDIYVPLKVMIVIVVEIMSVVSSLSLVFVLWLCPYNTCVMTLWYSDYMTALC